MSGLDQFEQAFADLMAEYDFNMGHGEAPMTDKMFRLPPELEEEWSKRLAEVEKKIAEPHERLAELERKVEELELFCFRLQVSK